MIGLRWAAIATYLPQRTDNDIKNYWNTHLKKRVAKKDHDPPPPPLSTAPTPTTYASSTENISRLMEGWVRSASPGKDSAVLVRDDPIIKKDIHPTYDLESFLGISYPSIIPSPAPAEASEIALRHNHHYQQQQQSFSFLENWLLGGTTSALSSSD